MNDQEIKIVIKSLFENAGTQKSLGDLRLLVQATEKGSKDAAAALDKWRATYGRLKNELSNTGGGLASSASSFMNPPAGQQDSHVAAYRTFILNQRRALPPVIAPPVIPGAEQSAGMGYGMRRHLGAVAGQALGLPGLGTVAAVGGVAAGIGAAILVAEKLLRVINETVQAWHKSAMAMTASLRSYQTIDQRIESINQRQLELIMHNQHVALSFAQIEREVNNVSTAIQHEAAFQADAAKFAERVADMELQRDLARIQFQNRFNPIERIRQESAAEEAAYQRRMERETAIQQAQINRLKQAADLHAQQGQLDLADAAQKNKGLPGIQKIADDIKETSKITAGIADTKISLDERELAVIKRLKNPLNAAFRKEDLGEYNRVRAEQMGIHGAGEFSTFDTAVMGSISNPILGQAQMASAAAGREAELEARKKVSVQTKRDAEDAAKKADHAVGLLTEKRDISVKHAEEEERKKKESLRDAANAQEILDREAADKAKERSAETEGRGYRDQLNILNSLPSANPGTSSGGADANQVLKDILEVQKNQVVLTQQMLNQWAA